MNGPVSGAGEEEPVWERAWSLEEIRRSSHSWSLGADAGLLNFLKDFSHQIISRTHDIEKQLDGLVHDVKTSDCRLHNVFHDFLMLSNTQFIENRVYDEEVEEHIGKPEQAEKPEQEKTREQKEAELIPKIQEAVNYGLQVLETAFEQLDIKAGNSDSEEDEVNEKVELILEPKDLYIDRPLPYLIGSQLFMQQEDVGLGDVSSEEGSVDNDRGSMIDSEEEEEEDDEDKDNEEDSEDDFGNNSEDEKKLPTALSDEDEDNGSDLFGASDKEDEEENDKSTKTRTRSFADELAARIQADVPKKQENDQTSISSGKTKKEKEKKEARPPSDDEEDDMFKPPKLTDEDFFGNKGGLFSGGRGLFDDDEDDEEGDLFSDIQTKERKPAEPPPVTKPEPLASDVKKKLPYGGVSLFPGGENMINASLLADKDKKKPAVATEVAPKPAVSSGLFDDDADALFGSAPAQPAAKPKPAADLFADDDDLFNDGASIPPAKTDKTKGATDLDTKNIQVPTEKPKTPLISSKKLTKGLFSDEEDSESDLFSPIQTASKPKPAAATSAAPAKSKPSAALSLFDEDDDLFGAVSEKKPSTIAPKPAQPPTLPAAPLKSQKSGLFSSDEEEPVRVSHDIKPADKKQKSADDPPKAKTEKISEQKSSLFDEEDEEDLFAITKDSQKKHHRVSLLFEEDQNGQEPLFASSGNTAAPAATPVEQTKPTAPVKVEAEKVSLFDDFDEKSKPKPVSHVTPDTPPPPALPKEEVKPDLQDSDGEDLFSATPPTIKNAKAKTSNVLSLFGEEDENDAGSLLQSNTLQKESEKVSKEKSAQAKSTRVFQDEELLFSQELQKDNDPDVDLFASSSKKSTDKPSAVKPSVASGLFGDDDDDDLFSAAKPKKPPKVQEKKTVIKKEPLEPPRDPSGVTSVKPDPALKTGGAEANLLINPTALLPGAIPKVPAARHASPETSTSYTPAGESTHSSDTGVSFETPAQVDLLHSANKSRAKVGGKRRPPSRMGRKLASQDSDDLMSPTRAPLPEAAMSAGTSSLKLSFSENDVHSRTKPKASVNPLTPDVSDLFGSDLFGDGPVPGPSVSRQKIKSPATEPIKEEASKPAPVFDEKEDDLFQSIKDKPKKPQPSALLENEDDDDLFGAQKPQKKADLQQAPPKEVKTTISDIFQDDIFAAEAVKPVKKPKEKKPVTEANLFDDNSDIFSDLTSKHKEKKPKKKTEAKSIFEDDMDDIFSTSNVKKSKPKAKSTPPVSEAKPDSKASSAFDDPLNVFGN